MKYIKPKLSYKTFTHWVWYVKLNGGLEKDFYKFKNALAYAETHQAYAIETVACNTSGISDITCVRNYNPKTNRFAIAWIALRAQPSPRVGFLFMASGASMDENPAQVYS